MDFSDFLLTINKLASINVPQEYFVVGGLFLLMGSMWLSEWLSQGAIFLVIRLFRAGGERGPVGRELARQMLEAAGERGIVLDETVQDSTFRIQFDDMDYQPETGTLWLTKDKANGANFASAGQVALEVGRVLQHKDDFFLLRIKRLFSPLANFAGFAWVWPFVWGYLLPLWLPEQYHAIIGYPGYLLTALLFGFLGTFVLLKIPIGLDAARRGVSAMNRARVFSGDETAVIYLFLGIILFLTTLASLIIALNFFRFTAPTKT